MMHVGIYDYSRALEVYEDLQVLLKLRWFWDTVYKSKIICGIVFTINSSLCVKKPILGTKVNLMFPRGMITRDVLLASEDSCLSLSMLLLCFL